MLQQEIEHAPKMKTDAAAAFLASLEEPKLTSLSEAGKKPPIEILPPGMVSLYAPISVQKKSVPAIQGSQQQQPGKPLLLEAPPTATSNGTAPAPSEPSNATAEDNNPSSSSVPTPGPDPDPAAVVPTSPASTSGPVSSEDTPREPDIQAMSVPAPTTTALPVSDPLS